MWTFYKLLTNFLQIPCKPIMNSSKLFINILTNLSWISYKLFMNILQTFYEILTNLFMNILQPFYEILTNFLRNSNKMQTQKIHNCGFTVYHKMLESQWKLCSIKRRHDTQPNDIYYKDTQHNCKKWDTAKRQSVTTTLCRCWVLRFLLLFWVP